MGLSLINYIIKKHKRKFKLFGCSRNKESDKYFNLYKENKLNNFKFFKVDLNKDTKKLINILKKVKPNIIFNFAAQSTVEHSWDNPEDWYNTNLISNIKLLEYLRSVKYLYKYIQSSTPEVYGSTKKKIIENFNYSPSTPYASSKAAIDMLLKNYYDNYDFPVVFTRVSNIYGPGQKIYKIIPKTIISILKNKKVPLHGNGISKRSFIFSDDVSEAMLKIMNKSKNGQIYHVTNEKMYSIKNVVMTIAKIMNRKFEDCVTIESERPGKDFIYNMSAKKIRKLKWKAITNLTEGIIQTKNWVEKNYLFIKKANFKYKHQK
tara:strand:+ start:2474 stop:3430 length:957 start_codon:yes stop_codon:yes gene_type:complete